MSKIFNCIQIEITNDCNYKCLMCPNKDMTRPVGYMDFKLFKKVVDESYKISKGINFSFFGEPTLHPNFLEYLEYLKNRPKSCKVIINSNMSNITSKIYEKFIRINLSSLRISLDSSDEKTYNILRPGSSCLDLQGNKSNLNNRFKLIEDKVKYWFGLKNHTPTRHVYTVSSINRKEIYDFVKKWQPFLGYNDIILIKNVLTYGGKIYDKIMCNSNCNIEKIKMATIDWQGNISPCNLDTNMDLSVDNVRDKQIVDVRKSEKWREMLNKIKTKNIIPCNKCFDSNNWSKNININRGMKYNKELVDRYYFTKED